MYSQNELDFPHHGNQYISTVGANLVFLSHGCMIGWLSPATELLSSNHTPLKTGPLTEDQLSWIGSINAIGAILATFTFGFITSLLGCKRTILLLAIPSTIFFSLVFFGDTYYYILIARFMTGWSGGGAQITIIMYIADIANNSIRGRLGSFSPLLRNIGILLAFIVGSHVPYKLVPCVFITIPIVFAVWFFLLPNTPQFYLEKGNQIKAEKSLKFYKGIKSKSTLESTAFNIEFARLKALANQRFNDERIQMKDVFNRRALLGILNGSILASLGYLTGYLAFTTYAVKIFQESGASDINPYYSSIVLALLQLIANLCTATLSDSFGRKKLLIVSLIGSSLGIYCVALFSYLRHLGYTVSSFQWVPVASLSVVIFTASAGVAPLMFIGMVENVPPKIRTLGLTICNVIMNVANFTTLKVFPTLMKSVGLHGAMLIFAIPCTFGIFYVFFIIKETKGIALDAQKNDKNENT